MAMGVTMSQYVASHLTSPPGSSPTGSTAEPTQSAVPLNRAAIDPHSTLTILIPTRDESENVGALLEQLGPAFASLKAEILVIDDSNDETPAVLAACAETCHLPVRLLHRPPTERQGGLAGAVIAGAKEARGAWILVMDGDLQHPPHAAAALARIATRHDVDILIGTRYAGTGARSGLRGVGRQTTSSLATRLTRTVFPRRLATVTDPMSGLFAFRQDAIDLDRLSPVGFKILLELLVRNPGARVAEFAYELAPRYAGKSKASLREGLAFVQHLTRLRRHRLVGQLRSAPVSRRERILQLSRMVTFGLVGLSGVAVNTAALWFFYHSLGLHQLVGAALATQASTLWNFALIDLFVYRKQRRGRAIGRASRFLVMNNLLLVARLPALQLLIWSGLDVLVANAITLVLLFALRFVMSDRVIYGSPRDAGREPVRRLVDPDAFDPPITSVRKRSRYLPYRYDVAGTVTIGSQIKLPELEFFRAQWISDSEVDIAVRVGDVGGRGPSRRAAMTEYAHPTTLRYEEHLGRLGANFRIELGSPIDITVGPLLARSPHVVYTNIVEALLRFVMVSRGKMLLHSACVNLDGVGVMLSALTDTGKTATVLRLLREHGGRFLSDDMTVVDADGTATCFPKPLTISAHTLRAVQADDLTRSEWRRLQFQSRLHSKGGRSIALTLSRFNLPIMGINALTQILVPPPKYSVDRLVPCRMGSSTRVQELFIIERGAPGMHDLDQADTLERMLTNTDDAYGFPPFQYLAPAITIGDLGYQQLRDREREILAGFLSHLRARVLASDSYGWADEIPRLLAAGRADGSIRPSGAAEPANGVRLLAPSALAAGAVDAWPRWGGAVAAPASGGVMA
jgi:dolichol-phosphate mannosyltransferase